MLIHYTKMDIVWHNEELRACWYVCCCCWCFCCCDALIFVQFECERFDENHFVLLWYCFERNHQFSLSFSWMVCFVFHEYFCCCVALYCKSQRSFTIDLSLLLYNGSSLLTSLCFSCYCFVRIHWNTCILSTLRFMSILSQRHIK